jgi:hypothetical protein
VCVWVDPVGGVFFLFLSLFPWSMLWLFYQIDVLPLAAEDVQPMSGSAGAVCGELE